MGIFKYDNKQKISAKTEEEEFHTILNSNIGAKIENFPSYDGTLPSCSTEYPLYFQEVGSLHDLKCLANMEKTTGKWKKRGRAVFKAITKPLMCMTLVCCLTRLTKLTTELRRLELSIRWLQYNYHIQDGQDDQIRVPAGRSAV